MKRTLVLFFIVFFSPSLLWAAGGELTWGPDGKAVCEISGEQTEIAITESNAGAIITWRDKREDDGDIYAQSIDRFGNMKWEQNGAAICTIEGSIQFSPALVSDGEQGAIITWSDNRSGWDIYAQRIGVNGDVQWAEKGVVISSATGEQKSPQITTDEAGGAIIAWQDTRSGELDIYAQKISSNGIVGWAANGVAISTASGDQENARIVPDTAGGAIIVWEDYRSGGADIYAQRIAADGNPTWAVNGTSVCVASGNQTKPQIIADGVGGAIIVWEDERSGAKDIYAQRITADGERHPDWVENGVAVCIATLKQLNPALTTDKSTGTIIVWEDERSHEHKWDIYAQRITADGERHPDWVENGVAICTGTWDKGSPGIVTDDSGDAIIVWQDERVGNWDIYCQKISSTGTLKWILPHQPYGVAVSTATNEQEKPVMVSDGSKGAIIAWTDTRNFTLYYHDIYAQHITDAETIPPCAITNLSAQTGSDSDEVDLVWTAPGDNGTVGTAHHYSIRYTTDVSFDWGANWSNANIWKDERPVSGEYGTAENETCMLVGQTTYYFYIRGYDKFWNQSELSNGATACARMDTTPPSEITDLSGTPGWGDAEIDLNWTAPGDNDTRGTAIYYEIRYAQPPFSWDTASIWKSPRPVNGPYGTPETETLTGLIAGATYSLQIKAYDETGVNWSTSTLVSTQAQKDRTPPFTVGDLRVSSFTATTIELTWTASGDDGRIGTASYYDVRYSIIGVIKDTTTWEAANTYEQVWKPQKAGQTEKHRLTGLIGDTIYWFALKTGDERKPEPNWSGISNSPLCKTKDIIPPAAIADLCSSTGTLPGEVDLVWSAPGDNNLKGDIVNGKFRIAYSRDPNYSFSYEDYRKELPVSCSPGDKQFYTVTGLHAGATHYFRIWTADEVPLWSDISNGATTYSQWDTTEPVSGIAVPIDGERYSTLTSISGTADDDYSGVDYIDIAIQYIENGTTHYWKGSTWGLTFSTLPVEGINPWNYNFTGNWETGKEYLINSWATDIGYEIHRQGDGPQYYAPGKSRFVFDNLPPKPITNLSALTGGQGGEIKLSWTAPWDEPVGGGGLVKAYFVRYASYSIADLGGDTTVWWDSAKSVGDDRCVVPFGRTEPPAPPKVGSGSRQELTLGRLDHGVTYWFAIKSEDDALPEGNLSDIDTTSPQAQAVARYGDEATFFKVYISSWMVDEFVAGVRSNFVVEPWNPNQRGTGYRGTVHFSSDDGEAALPDDYTFNSTDAVEGHTFIGGVIFRTPGEKYVLVRDTTTPTIGGQQSGITVKAKYTDIVDRNGKEIILPDGVPQDGNMSIVFPQGAVSKATIISIKVDETGGGHQDPENKYIDSLLLSNAKPIAGYYVCEVEPCTSTGKKLLTISLLYPDINPADGKVDGTNIEEENLRCFWWDGFHWRYLGGSVEKKKNVVIAKTNKLGLFALFPVKGEYARVSLQDTKPKRKIITPFGDNPEAEFVGLEEPFKIIIYDFTGQVVREIDQYPARWDGTDGSGRTVESGIYIYKIQKDGEEVTGTIVVAK